MCLKVDQGPLKVTQGCLSFLPMLTSEQVRVQIRYCLKKGWAISFEYTRLPHPRHTYWDMWGLPLFDVAEVSEIEARLESCREAHPDCFIRMSAFDASRGIESH